MPNDRPVRAAERRLVIVSNRLPVSLERGNGQWQVKPSSGGLVTALGPVLRNRGGLWLGWPGVPGTPDAAEPLRSNAQTIGYTLVPVALSAELIEHYYHGFSNEILWPLFHSLQSLCNYDPQYWTAYCEANRRFAAAVKEHTGPDDYIWVHDYHLMHVAHLARELRLNNPIGFFLHIPFPPPVIFQKLPWRVEILESLLSYDLLGFQTETHKRNFLDCVRSVLKTADVAGRGQLNSVKYNGREVRVGSFPIGIDYESFASQAETQEVTAIVSRLKDAVRGRCLLLGVDRLDYTKGIPYKLLALRTALMRYPELHGKITFIQVVVPSRNQIPSYERLKHDIERLVGEINGEFAEPGWVPIQYVYRSLKRAELVAYYRAADIALVTPLEDGMNLVAKEFCASSVDGNNVLVLSEFAGAAVQLRRGALVVNPYDREGVAHAIHYAFKMERSDRQERMRRLQRNVREQNIFNWVDSFLLASRRVELDDFPLQVEPAPVPEVEQWWEGG